MWSDHFLLFDLAAKMLIRPLVRASKTASKTNGTAVFGNL
jgi:hypothetical protein